MTINERAGYACYIFFEILGDLNLCRHGPHWNPWEEEEVVARFFMLAEEYNHDFP